MKKGHKHGHKTHILGHKSIIFLRVIAFFFGFVALFIIIFGKLPLGNKLLIFDGISRLIAISPALLSYMLLVVVGELEAYQHEQEKKHKKE